MPPVRKHTLWHLLQVPLGGGRMPNSDLTGDVIHLEASRRCAPHWAPVLSVKLRSLTGYSGRCWVIQRHKTTTNWEPLMSGRNSLSAPASGCPAAFLSARKKRKEELMIPNSWPSTGSHLGAWEMQKKTRTSNAQVCLEKWLHCLGVESTDERLMMWFEFVSSVWSWHKAQGIHSLCLVSHPCTCGNTGAWGYWLRAHSQGLQCGQWEAQTRASRHGLGRNSMKNLKLFQKLLKPRCLF